MGLAPGNFLVSGDDVVPLRTAVTTPACNSLSTWAAWPGAAPGVSSYEVYLGLYQAITGPEENQKLFREFSPGFFDLIVIDECHRGSAAEDSAWREILDHFSAAPAHSTATSSRSGVYVVTIEASCEPPQSAWKSTGIGFRSERTSNGNCQEHDLPVVR
jgi:hypothetical protein